ncbi:MAG: O-antigen ligase family protein [Solirubrobacteraceae bacterium]
MRALSSSSPVTGPVAAGATAAAAIAGGAVYALSAYELAPDVLPVAALALAAVAIAIWRLELGIALLIMATPFAENAPISQPGQAKLRVALVLLAMLLVGARALGTIVQRDARLPAPPLLGAAALYLTAALLSVPAAEDGKSAVAKFMLLSGAVVLYLLISMYLADWDRLKVVLVALLVVGLLISVHAIYQQLAGHVSRIGFISTSGAVEYRITSVFPHPNQLAGFLGMLVPVAVGLATVFRRRMLRVAAWALFALAIIAVAFTQSRGALLGLAVLPVLFVHDRRSWPVIALAGVLVVVSAPNLYRDRIAGTSQLQRPEVAERIDIWQAAVDTFQAHPVLGVGLDNFPLAYLDLERPARSFLGSGFDLPPTAHNLYLNTLAEQGLAGGAALLFLAVSFIRAALELRRSADPRIRAMGRALLGVALVLAVHNVFDVTFSDAKNATMVWVLFGVTAALLRIERRAAPEPV